MKGKFHKFRPHDLTSKYAGHRLIKLGFIFVEEVIDFSDLWWTFQTCSESRPLVFFAVHLYIFNRCQQSILFIRITFERFVRFTAGDFWASEKLDVHTPIMEYRVTFGGSQIDQNKLLTGSWEINNTVQLANRVHNDRRLIRKRDAVLEVYWIIDALKVYGNRATNIFVQFFIALDF